MIHPRYICSSVVLGKNMSLPVGSARINSAPSTTIKIDDRPPSVGSRQQESQPDDRQQRKPDKKRQLRLGLVVLAVHAGMMRLGSGCVGTGS